MQSISNEQIVYYIKRWKKFIDINSVQCVLVANPLGSSQRQATNGVTAVSSRRSGGASVYLSERDIHSFSPVLAINATEYTIQASLVISLS